MPRLYCAKHGKENKADTARDQEEYRQGGETVLVVSGRLISGPWHCDRCNATLKKGDTAYLSSAFPQWITEGLTDYDFAYERDYFAMAETDAATVYGAEWPDDSIRNRRPVRRTGKQAKSPPLCALDIRPSKPGK